MRFYKKGQKKVEEQGIDNLKFNSIEKKYFLLEALKA